MKQGTRFARIRRTYWIHTLLMVLVAVVLILPLKIELVYLSSRDDHVVTYYVLSLALVLIAQFVHLRPFRQLVIIDKVKYLVGMSFLTLLIMVWLGQHDSMTLDFSELRAGELMGPLAMALGFPVIQAFINFTYTDTVDADK